MSAPTTEIVWACVEAMLAMLEGEAALAAVAIDSGWPGDAVAPQQLWVGDIDSSDLEYPIMTGARIPVDEGFDVHLHVGVFDQLTNTDTHARLSEILGAVDSTLREAPNLNAADGVRSALVTSKRRTVADTPDGPQGYAEIVVRFETRIA